MIVTRTVVRWGRVFSGLLYSKAVESVVHHCVNSCLVDALFHGMGYVERHQMPKLSSHQQSCAAAMHLVDLQCRTAAEHLKQAPGMSCQHLLATH